MTFPTIPTGGRVLTTNQTGTSATRTFPNLSSLTKNSGDLLIAIIVAYQSTATANAVFSSWGGGFTEFVDQSTTSGLAIGAAFKVSTGSETGTFTVTEAATITGDASMILLSIPGASGATPEATVIANGTTALADPVSLSPSWGALDTLWIVVAGNGETAITGSWTGVGTTPPTNYSNTVDTATPDNSLVGQVAAGVAFRQLNAASENVGTWGSSDISNARNSSLVIAVKPAPGPIATTELEGITDSQAWQQDKVFTDPEGVTNFADLAVGKVQQLSPDAVGITDSASVGLTGGPQNWSVTPVDPVGIIDLAAKDQVTNPADTVGITDTSAIGQTKAFTESEGITDTSDVVLDTNIDSNADAVGITDTAALVKSLTITPTDSIGITDLAAKGQTINPADAVGITDLAAKGQTINPADAVGVTDTVDKGQTINPADAVGITDTPSVIKSVAVVPADSVGITDTSAIQQDKVYADSVGITDTPVLALDHGVQPADLVGITDTSAIQQDKAFADNIGITDTSVVALDHAVQPADSIGILDTGAVVGDYQRAPIENIGITDGASLSLQSAGAVSPIDAVGITDSAVLVVAHTVAPVDVVGIADNAAAAKTIALQVADAVGIADQAGQAGNRAITFTDAVGITDAALLEKPGSGSLILGEVFGPQGKFIIPIGPLRVATQEPIGPQHSVHDPNGPLLERSLGGPAMVPAEAVAGPNIRTVSATGPEHDPPVLVGPSMSREVTGPEN